MFIMCCCRDVAGAVCLSCAVVEMWQVLCVYMCCCRDVAGAVCL